MRSAAVILLLGCLAGVGGAATDETPPNLTVAFLGDQGLGDQAVAVLTLVRNEGAAAVVHSGDFDYRDDPAAWMAQIDAVLGPDFPYFASAGNHDELAWDGYQAALEARTRRLGIAWDGRLGVESSLRFAGLFIVLTAPGVFGAGDGTYDGYLAAALAADDSIWRISSWHKNMTLMQVGDKIDETGWGVYEAARRGGAIIATAHSHGYSRTHLLASCETPTIASTDDLLVLRRDDPATVADEGRTFVFVSALGGEGVRRQLRPTDPWWASVYTADQGADAGALFGVFNYDGDARLAYFYFKDVAGRVPDAFYVRSSRRDAPPPPPPPPVEGDVPIPGRRLRISNGGGRPAGVRLLFASRGPTLRAAEPGSAGDPRCGAGAGGSLEVLSTTSARRVVVPLPCEHWSLVGSEARPKGYRYLDRAAGGAACKVVVKRGGPTGLVRAVCAGRSPGTLDYDLHVGEGELPVRVRLDIGTAVAYCAEFRRAERRDGSDGRLLLARDAPAPAGCAAP